jgi:hypothetical protein
MTSVHDPNRHTLLADSHPVLSGDSWPPVPEQAIRVRRGRGRGAGSSLLTASLLAIALAACGSVSSGQTPSPSSAPSSATRSAHVSAQPPPSSLPAAVARARSHSRSRIEGDVNAARTIYYGETQGPRLLEQLGRLARDPLMLSALAKGDAPAAQAEADAQLYSTLNHTAHVTRIAVLRGSHALVNATINANGVFVCAPGVRVLRLHGRPLGTLLVSIQDVVGFVKLIHRLVHVQAVVRGASGLVRTSLPAAAHVSLPASGRVTIASRSYLAQSFSEVGWGGEPLTVWVLEAM